MISSTFGGRAGFGAAVAPPAHPAHARKDSASTTARTFAAGFMVGSIGDGLRRRAALRRVRLGLHPLVELLAQLGHDLAVVRADVAALAGVAGDVEQLCLVAAGDDELV